MCLSFPGRVIALSDVGAIVQCPDRVRRASTLLVPDVGLGEHVAVAAGTIVARLTPEEAAELEVLIEGALDAREDLEPTHPTTTPSTEKVQ